MHSQTWQRPRPPPHEAGGVLGMALCSIHHVGVALSRGEDMSREA